MLTRIWMVTLAAGTICCATFAQTTPQVRHIQSDVAPIATAVWAGDTLFVSGQTASPVQPSDTAKQSELVYGDTHAQTVSILHKIDAILTSQSLSLQDVVSMKVYLVGVPALGGTMDFAGFQSAYAEFFGTLSRPLKPARATVQVAALAHGWSLVEIEVVAFKAK